MWFFKSKAEPKPERKNPFILPFPMGARINYLGVRLVVTGHWDQCCGGIPKLRADYVNAHGEIKAIQFSAGELPALMAENMRAE